MEIGEADPQQIKAIDSLISFIANDLLLLSVVES